MTSETQSRPFRAALLVLVALALGSCGSELPTQEPPKAGSPAATTAPDRVTEAPAAVVTTGAGVVLDEWFRIRIQGETAGHSRRTVYRTPDGNFRTRITQKISLRRGQVPLVLEVEQETEESADGRWLRFTLMQSMSAKRILTEGEVRGDKLYLKIAADGAPRSLTIPFDPKNRGHYWVQEEAQRRLRKPGDVFITRTFLPELRQSAKVRITLREKESVQVGTERRTLYARTTKMALLPDPIKEWVDDQGTLWKGQFKLGGITLEEIRTTREDVLSLRIDTPPEIFLSTAVVPSRPLPQASSVVFRIALVEGDFASRNLEDAFRLSGQTLLPGGSASVRVVRIDRVTPGSEVAYPPTVDAGLASYLRPGALIQSDDPAIAAKARELVAGVKEIHAAARKLESWVHDHIQTKDLRTAFASAKETFESARGDCTEHGVLLAALARAAGIPARIVTGLVYHDGRFVGHLWTEVFVDRWIPLDATRPGRVGPTHIALTTSDLSDASGLGAFIQLASFIGNLKIEIVEP